jgi:hypothetical protein
MEAARTSETSVDIQLRTRQYIPEDSELHTCLRENFKSHTVCFPFTELSAILIWEHVLISLIILFEKSIQMCHFLHLCILYDNVLCSL